MWSADDDFQKVLSVAAQQFASGKIRIRFGPSGKTRLTVDETSLEKRLTEVGVSQETFRRVFNLEIINLLNVILQGRLDDYTKGRLPFPFEQQDDTKDQGKREKMISQRASLVERDLVGPDLRARYLIKVSSKHPRLRGLRWEVGRKLYESASKSAISREYVTLSFETIQPEADVQQFFALLPFLSQDSAGRIERFSFDLDKEDLDDLIESLQAANRELGGKEPEG